MKIEAACIHYWIIDSDNKGICKCCGEEKQFPWEFDERKFSLGGHMENQANVNISKRTRIQEKHQYYKAHKAEILAKVKTKGESATRKEYQIPSGSWTGLMKRWGRREKATEAEGRARKVAPLVPVASSNSFPNLPPWNDQWSPEVQIKWLEVWSQHKEVCGGHKG